MPSAPTTHAVHKPVSVYPQHPQSNVPVRPQGTAASSPAQSGRFEGRPTAQPTSTATATTATPTPPQAPPKPTPAQTQHISSSFQPSRPTATAPTASFNAQKPNTGTSQSQAQTTTSRPQTQISEVRPNRPTISAPQVQHQGSTSSQREREREQAAAKEHAAASAATSTNPTRPRLHGGTPSQNHTQYVNMLLALDDIPALYNLLAGFFTWILLAGFILFPGTFTSLQNVSAGTPGLPAQVEQQLINAVTHLPLFIVAWVCTGIGVFGMIWLWWRWRKNYIWALNKIFLPGLLNSLAGLLSTIANIFGVQNGELSKTSKVTVIVTTAATGVLGILTLFYMFWLVRRVKANHDREVGKERAGKYGEGVVDLSKKR
ncbi:hypothetical protein GALMADRAFT_76439 [Galerina marginata CBS 339.88]|uniref:Uncharacterized protein n=1 Tax=Galerina marginata (strain CBS 339.88) TaxID=685588 RepID=A0A067STY9_GALM3|nr:hypothetical protein GALMADRAFT_76439 [Galerina marginata CBS 339.88]